MPTLAYLTVYYSDKLPNIILLRKESDYAYKGIPNFQNQNHRSQITKLSPNEFNVLIIQNRLLVIP